jgi:hypothetical protein
MPAAANIPERGQQFRFIDARNELDRLGGVGFLFEIFSGEQHLSALGICIEHGDADGVRGERPETELLQKFGAAGGSRGGVGDFAALPKKVFLLNVVELLERERGCFDVEDQFSHGLKTNQDGKPVEQTRFAIPISQALLLLLTDFLLGFLLSCHFVHLRSGVMGLAVAS